MTEVIVTDILRDVVSSIGTTLLLFVLMRPKYEKKVMVTAFLCVCLLNCSSILFCIFSNYTIVTRFSLLFYIVTGIFLKPFFRDSWPKWCFNVITMMNIFASIVILSYNISLMLPHPRYANIVLRVILFTVVIFLFMRFLRDLYQKVVERWNVVLLLAGAIFLNYGYYLILSRDIVKTLFDDFVPLFLLIVLSFAAYVTVFFFLLKISKEYELREENFRMHMQQKLLGSELQAYEDFVAVANQYRHDLRHHNAILSEFLSEGNMCQYRFDFE